MVVMSDRALEALKRKRLRQLRKKLSLEESIKTKEKETEKLDSKQILNRVFSGRAWEVFHAAHSQFPQVMDKITVALVKLVSSGRVTMINGKQLYVFLRKLGLRVRLNTKITFTDHGKLKSLAEKLKEDYETTRL